MVGVGAVVKGSKLKRGNYCGACRINGKFFDGEGQRGWRSEEIGEGRMYHYYDGETGEKKTDYAPDPLDAFDRCCMEHDRCLADVEHMDASAVDKSWQTKACDERLSWCWLQAFFNMNLKIEARIKVVTGIPVMAVVAHPSDTANVVTDVANDVLEDLGDGLKQAFEFLGEGVRNASEYSNGVGCHGNCILRWNLPW